jgi:threonine dehydratase
MSAAKLAVGMLCAADIDAAYVRIGTAVHRTPVFTSQSIDDMLGNSCRVFFKCENLQKTGSFKARGAVNAVVFMHGSV